MTQDRDPHQEVVDFIRLCEYRARCHVQGAAYHDKLRCNQPVTGGWSVHFRSHPRVVEAEAEGWAGELRSALVVEAKRRLMKREDVGDPDELMPISKRWWENRRARAKQYRDAAAQRDAKLNGKGQAGVKASGVLSDLSRRITGEANSGG